MPASPKESVVQTTKKLFELKLSFIFDLSRRVKNGMKVWRELQQMLAINRSAAEQFKCFKINRKDLFKTRTLISFNLQK